MPISNTSQLGLIRLGLAQLGVVEPVSTGPSVSDASTLAESVSISVIGAPWLLEASVVDTVAAAESMAWQVNAALSVFDAASAAENVALGLAVDAFDSAVVAESVSLNLLSSNSSLMLLGIG